MLIAFEGVPGGGKTTQIALLKNSLEQRGLMVAISDARDISWPSAFLGNLGKNYPFRSQERDLLWLMIRLMHPFFLKDEMANRIVISDRAVGSLIAYAQEGIANFIPLEFWDTFLKKAPLTVPDVTVLLDVDYTTAVARKDCPTTRDVDFFQALRERFLSLAQHYDWLVIDGAQSQYIVADAVMHRLEEPLHRWLSKNRCAI